MSASLEETKRAVVYLYSSDKNPSIDLPSATGFFCQVPTKQASKANRNFLIVAKHSINKCSEIKIRYISKTLKEKVVSMKLIKSGTAQNVYLPKSENVDLAAITVNEMGIVTLKENQILDLEGIKMFGINEGTSVICIGYSKNNPGFKKMYPALRFGRISSLNFEPWHKEGSTDYVEFSYLIDMHLTHGASGSPIIIEPQQSQSSLDGRRKLKFLPILILGIVKGSPDTLEQHEEPPTNVKVSQAVTCIEPGEIFKSFLNELPL